MQKMQYTYFIQVLHLHKYTYQKLTYIKCIITENKKGKRKKKKIMKSQLLISTYNTKKIRTVT